MTTLSELADAVERLQGPSMKHDILIENACVEPTGQPKKWLALKYTGSLDAALTLVPEDMFWRVGHDADDPSGFTAQVSYSLPDGMLGFVTATADTPALALTAAASRAKASGEGA